MGRRIPRRTQLCHLSLTCMEASMHFPIPLSPLSRSGHNETATTASRRSGNGRVTLCKRLRGRERTYRTRLSYSGAAQNANGETPSAGSMLHIEL